MAYHLSELPGQAEFGIVVNGFDPDMLDDPMIRKELYDLWIDKGVILFRETSGLDTHLRLSEVFGVIEEHPLLGKLDIPREDKVSLNMIGTEGPAFIVNGEERTGWLAWHKDSIYTDRINHGSLLWSIRVPERSGQTGFIDQIAAYDAMPDELKRRVEGLSVLYCYTLDSTESRFGDQPDRRLRLDEAHANATRHYLERPRSIHPMVYTQEQTGRKVINVSPWFADGIEGMENPEGDALLREVIAHILKPELAYYHSWSPGEMVLWDNWRMLHCTTGTPVGMNRHMRRTTIAGDYALGRLELVRAEAR